MAKSNFEFIKDYDALLFAKYKNLEEELYNVAYKFDIEARRLLEGALSRKYNLDHIQNLGQKIDWFIKTENDINNPKKHREFKLIRNLLFNLNAKLNEEAHNFNYNSTKFVNNIINERKTTLQQLHGIIAILLDKEMVFDYGIYKNKVINYFENNLTIYQDFDNYIKENAGISTNKLFTTFITEKVLSNFSHWINDYEDCYINSRNNGGINSWLWNKVDQELNILCSNYTTDNLETSDFSNKLKQINETLKRIILTKQNSTFNQKLKNLTNEHYQDNLAIYKINIYFCTIQNIKKVNFVIDKYLKLFKETLGCDINIYFKNEQLLDKDYVFNNYSFDTEIAGQLELTDEHSYAIIPSKKNQFTTLLCAITAQSLVEYYKNSDKNILEKNIRGYLKNPRIDNAIIESISKDPHNFIVFNNGITAIAYPNGNDYIIDNKLNFKHLYIINGGQTTHILSEAKYQLNDINVFAKIIVINDKKIEHDLIDEIAKASNQQKPIKPEDLWSNHQRAINFERIMESTNPDIIFLRKRDDSLKARNRKINKKTVGFKDLAQLFYSFYLLRPDVAKNNTQEIWANDFYLNKIFDLLNITKTNVNNYFKDVLLTQEIIEKYKRKAGISKNLFNKWIPQTPRDIKLIEIKQNGWIYLLATIGALVVFINLDKEKQYNVAACKNEEVLDLLVNAYTQIKVDQFIKRKNKSEDNFEFFENNFNKLLQAIALTILNQNAKEENWSKILKRKTTFINLLIDGDHGIFNRYLSPYDDFKELVDSCLITF